MKSFFSLDSPFFRALTVVSDLAVFNMLWLLCCLPVFTAGAATAALYDVLFRMVRSEGGATVKAFFSAFRSNFKKATLLWLIMLAAGLAVLAEYDLLSSAGLSPVFLALPMLGLLLWLFVNTYLFPLTARFENSVGGTFRNALLLSVANFPRTLVVATLQASPFILAFAAFEVFYRISILWLLLGGAGMAYVNTLMLNTVFAGLNEK
jgi:uncharacterized membrane protein YesL